MEIVLAVLVREAGVKTYYGYILAEEVGVPAAELQIQQQQVSVQAVSVNQPLQSSCKHPAIYQVTDINCLSAQAVRRCRVLNI